MIDEKIENKIDRQPKNKMQIIVSVMIIIAVIIIFALFMTFDFSKEPESQILSPGDRMRILQQLENEEEVINNEERLRLLQQSRNEPSLTPEERLELLNNN
jgi:flagellar biosynthesis/type III secretory pathway M-ring protein FliF/YscJ